MSEPRSNSITYRENFAQPSLIFAEVKNLEIWTRFFNIFGRSFETKQYFFNSINSV